MTRSRIFKLTLLVTVAFCAALATDALPWLRGDVPWIPKDVQWVWPYEHPRWAWLLPCILGIGVYLTGAVYHLNRAKAHRTRGLILWAFVGSALLPLLLMTLEGEPLFLLFTRSASRLTGGFQYALVMVSDLYHTLRDWPGFVKEYRANALDPGGISLSPPGLLVLYYAFERFFSAIPPLANTFGALVRPLECQNLYMMTWSNAEMASAWFQMFMPLWAALAVVPLYRLGTMLFDRERARLAVILWPLVPGLEIFVPRFNVLYPLITLVMLLALWRGLEQNRPRQIALGGFVVSGAIFLNLSLVPLGLLAGLVILGYHLVRRPAAFRLAIRDLALFGIGSASVWIIYWVLTGQTPWLIIRTGLHYHQILKRPYFAWLPMHTYDTFLFIGLPLSIFALWRIGRLRRSRIGPALPPGDLLAGAMALTLIIMVLSGTARGETGRVWLFFAPVWILLATDVLAGFSPRERTLSLVMQAACVLCMAAVLRANFTTLIMPPSPADASQPPMYPYSDVRFERGEDRITFVGVSVEKMPSQITLLLHWRADSHVQRPYVLSLVIVAPDGAERSLNWDPEGWDYPPSCWRPGHEFVDPVPIALGDPPVTGDWLFSLSIRDTFSLEPMQVTLPDGAVSTQVGIGPVHVPEGTPQ
ncbi:MAG TPA: hypothetical protein VMT24_19030 [Aggregatilineaceae bacterium]|nr:hypothetical protein [Aggregatilineaceae bacterium]